MSSFYAFEPAGNTIRYDVVAAGANDGDLGVEAEQVMIWNAGSTGVFINFSKTASPTTAVLPTVGTPKTGFFVPPGCWSYSVRGKRYFTAITQAGTATIFITPGEGF